MALVRCVQAVEEAAALRARTDESRADAVRMQSMLDERIPALLLASRALPLARR